MTKLLEKAFDEAAELSDDEQDALAQVAERLGATSINAYARYEQGRSVPTIHKLSELFAAVMPHRDLVLVESET